MALAFILSEALTLQIAITVEKIGWAVFELWSKNNDELCAPISQKLQTFEKKLFVRAKPSSLDKNNKNHGLARKGAAILDFKYFPIHASF